MRLILIALGRTLLDVSILEPDEPPANEEPEQLPGAAGCADLTIFGGPTPFGFRPTPDPWPPSWE